MLTDIFCRVVDNYGDAGVCWRLARQLAAAHGWRVRLWIDDLATLARLAPQADPQQAEQDVAGVHLVHWAHPAPDLVPGDVVVEAFACDPPPGFVARMREADAQPVWINLEYLSAQDWVESCHGLPSPQPGGLRKVFFFPGFTPRTGGLLREPDLLARRDAWQAAGQAAQAVRDAFLRPLGIPARASNERLVTLFCYPDAPASALAQALAQDSRPGVLAVPPGIAPYLSAGTLGQLRIVRIPFVSQPDYDQLLWSADLNFVRGEDSFVRAQWAGRPLVWHIYPQEEAAHLDKLDAWLDRYPAPASARAAQQAWNGAAGIGQVPALLEAALAPAEFAAWTAAARRWSDELGAQEDLAAKLARFCAQARQKRHG